MPYLYNGYCYQTADEVVSIANSYHKYTEPVQQQSQFVLYQRYSYYVSNGVPFELITGCQYRLSQSPMCYTVGTAFPYSTCSTVGPVEKLPSANVSVQQTLNTPASLDSPPPSDVITASWMVVSALTGAWALKQMRKSL